MKRILQNKIQAMCGVALVDGLDELNLRELMILFKSLKNKTLRGFVEGLLTVVTWDLTSPKVRDVLDDNPFIVVKEGKYLVSSYGQGTSKLFRHHSTNELISFIVSVETIYRLKRKDNIAFGEPSPWAWR